MSQVKLQKAGALCCVLASGDIVFFLVTNILHIYACLVTIFWVKSSEEATKSSTVELGVTVECWWLVQETLLYFINVINSFTQPFSLVDGIHQWKLFRNIGNMTQVSRECRKFQPYSAISVKILLTVLQKMDSFRSLDFIDMLQINQGWVYCFLFRDTQFHDTQFLNWVLVTTSCLWILKFLQKSRIELRMKTCKRLSINFFFVVLHNFMMFAIRIV